jgi:hypothetical protein
VRNWENKYPGYKGTGPYIRNLERHKTIELLLRRMSVCCTLLDNRQPNNNSRSDHCYAMNQYTHFNNRGGVFCVVCTEAKSVHDQLSMKRVPGIIFLQVASFGILLQILLP